MSTSKTGEINLEFRPSSYFWPLGLETHLLARIKGAKRKEALKRLIDEGRLDEIPDFLSQSALSDGERRAIGRIHPMFMGGEYLPDLEENEVEIARISLRSVTGDVNSVYARRGEGLIHFRVVDEYEGETLTGLTELSSEKPLTLGELYEFIVNACTFMEGLQINYEDDLEGMLGFFNGDSAFYPQFDDLLRLRVKARYPAPVEE